MSPDPRFAGVSINTRDLGPEDAQALLEESEAKLGLPCIDPARGGVDRILDAML